MPLTKPVGGKDFPRNLVEMMEWFSDEDACLDFLVWLRWPDGIMCRRCDAQTGWYTSRGDWLCSVCNTRTSITAGTVFEKSRVPLPLWFLLAWHMTSEKTAGISAKGAQRLLELCSYQTAWSMLHKLRSVMVRPGRDQLHNDVEVDETYVGGNKPGKRGRGAAGKAIVVIAVEVSIPRGFGRARLEVIPDTSKTSLHPFIRNNIEPGAVVLTDGWRAYQGIERWGYTHKPEVILGSGTPAHVSMPAVHRVTSLFKRSLLNSYQSYPQLHLQSYCDEWTFRFNRRKSEHRGQLFLRLLENAVACDPMPYEKMKLSTKPRTVMPTPSGQRGSVRTIAVTTARRPWRY